MVFAGVVVVDVMPGGAVWVGGKQMLERDVEGTERMGNGVHSRAVGA